MAKMVKRARSIHANQPLRKKEDVWYVDRRCSC
jgi:hypothetical protein